MVFDLPLVAGIFLFIDTKRYASVNLYMLTGKTMHDYTECYFENKDIYNPYAWW